MDFGHSGKPMRQAKVLSKARSHALAGISRVTLDRIEKGKRAGWRPNEKFFSRWG